MVTDIARQGVTTAVWAQSLIVVAKHWPNGLIPSCSEHLTRLGWNGWEMTRPLDCYLQSTDWWFSLDVRLNNVPWLFVVPGTTSLPLTPSPSSYRGGVWTIPSEERNLFRTGSKWSWNAGDLRISCAWFSHPPGLPKLWLFCSNFLMTLLDFFQLLVQFPEILRTANFSSQFLVAKYVIEA